MQCVARSQPHDLTLRGLGSKCSLWSPLLQYHCGSTETEDVFERIAIGFGPISALCVDVASQSLELSFSATSLLRDLLRPMMHTRTIRMQNNASAIIPGIDAEIMM